MSWALCHNVASVSHLPLGFRLVQHRPTGVLFRLPVPIQNSFSFLKYFISILSILSEGEFHFGLLGQDKKFITLLFGLQIHLYICWDCCLPLITPFPPPTGVYAWMTVNYLLGRFEDPDESSVSIMDLGGSSTQIVFEPSSMLLTNGIFFCRCNFFGGYFGPHLGPVLVPLGGGQPAAFFQLAQISTLFGIL